MLPTHMTLNWLEVIRNITYQIKRFPTTVFKERVTSALL